ncbi:MAG: PspC domain-containing protein [Chloroflexi bacterium]|nr:MAG: PspC domain-containing protein [Chloroflexota bacterium]
MRERLYRSRSDRMLFGVAGGMAEWLDLDPSLVRIVWALLILAGGVGLLLYIVAAIVIPEEPLGAPGAAAAGMAAGTPGGGATGAGTSADASPGASADADWHARRAARRAARNERRGNGAMIFGLILVLVGAWFLIDRYLNIDSALVFPAALIVIGGALVIGALARSGGRGPS